MNLKIYVAGALAGLSLLGGDALATPPPVSDDKLPVVINRGATTTIYRNRQGFPTEIKNNLDRLNTRLQKLEEAGATHSTEYATLKAQVDAIAHVTNTLGTLANTYADRQQNVINLLNTRNKSCSEYGTIATDAGYDLSATTFNIGVLKSELETKYGLDGNLLDEKIAELKNSTTMTEDEINIEVNRLTQHYDKLSALVDGSEACNKSTAAHVEERNNIINSRLLRYDRLLNDDIVTLSSKAVEEATAYVTRHTVVVDLTRLVEEICGNKHSELIRDYNISQGFEPRADIDYNVVRTNFEAKFPEGETSLKAQLEALKTATTKDPLPAENEPAPIDPNAPLPPPLSPLLPQERNLTPEEIATQSAALQTQYDASNNLLTSNNECLEAKNKLHITKNTLLENQVNVILERYDRLLALDPDTLTPEAIKATIHTEIPEGPTNSLALYTGLRVNPNGTNSVALNGGLGLEGRIGLGNGISLVIDGAAYFGENIPGSISVDTSTETVPFQFGFYSEDSTQKVETVEIEDYAKLGVGVAWDYHDGSIFRGNIGLGLNLGEMTTLIESQTDSTVYASNGTPDSENHSQPFVDHESTVSYSFVPNISTGVDFKISKGFYLGLAAKLGYNTNTENVDLTTSLKAGFDF